MKNIFPKITILSGLTATLILSGCTKLEETVYSQIRADQWKPTAADVPSIIAPVYSNMRALAAGWQGMFDVEEESADEIITPARPNGWVDGGTYQRMHRHQWTSNEGQPNGLWNRCFTGINTINRVIAQLNSGEIPLTTGKDALMAELRAMRAFYYYLLCDNHGNVPIVTDFT
ncbi:MAG TPA: RagB/SusD family nutrient uptake outer membrane protein, partial [Puia sp.]